jgi:hypothetical protein
LGALATGRDRVTFAGMETGIPARKAMAAVKAGPRQCQAAYFLRTIARAVRLRSIFSEKLRLPARIRSEVRHDPLSDSENQVANPLGGGEARSD